MNEDGTIPTEIQAEIILTYLVMRISIEMVSLHSHNSYTIRNNHSHVPYKEKPILSFYQSWTKCASACTTLARPHKQTWLPVVYIPSPRLWLYRNKQGKNWIRIQKWTFKIRIGPHQFLTDSWKKNVGDQPVNFISKNERKASYVQMLMHVSCW